MYLSCLKANKFGPQQTSVLPGYLSLGFESIQYRPAEVDSTHTEGIHISTAKQSQSHSHQL